MLAFISALIFILFLFIIFKKRRDSEDTRKPEDTGKETTRHKIKDFLSNIFIKKGKMNGKGKYDTQEEAEYKDLEKQIKEIGDFYEKGKEAKKRGVSGRFFKRK